MSEYVLVAEDDVKQADLIRLYLERDGFEVTVVHNGADALRSAAEDPPRLIVLDVMMPEVDGLDVCRELGGEGGIPIVLLTSRSTESDVLLGLYLGADDYMTKPFSPRELVARVHSVLRRTAPAQRTEPRTIQAGDIEVDIDRHEVTRNGEPVTLTPVEFDLLTVLAARRGRVLSRRQLLDLVRGTADFLTERTIDSHVMNLRRKVERDPRRPELIVTVYGIGYKFAEPSRSGEPDG